MNLPFGIYWCKGRDQLPHMVSSWCRMKLEALPNGTVNSTPDGTILTSESGERAYGRSFILHRPRNIVMKCADVPYNCGTTLQMYNRNGTVGFGKVVPDDNCWCITTDTNWEASLV